MTFQTVKIGTRGSRLALVQAGMVEQRLKSLKPSLMIEIVTIKSAADWSAGDPETRLSEEEGGKGMFAKELEQALLSGDIDIAVHSAKDMETRQPEGLILPVYLEREDPRDILITQNSANKGQGLLELEPGSRIGTASVRRQAFVKALRPDLEIVPLRGNVDTRLKKLEQGMADATILAAAGLNRLGIKPEGAAVIPPEDMLPAASQGAVCIECRDSDKDILAIISQLNHLETWLCVTSERAVIDVLDGSCHTPIGAHATFDGRTLSLRACVASLDGKHIYKQSDSVIIENNAKAEKAALQLGQKIGQALKAEIPEGFLS